MTITHRIGVDWDNDTFIAWDAAPGDTPNLADHPVDLSANTINVTGTGASQSAQAITEDFGIEAIDWVSGTSSNGALLIGSNADPIASVSALTAYTLSFWIRSESASYDAVPLRVRILDEDDFALYVGANFTVTLAAGWVQKVFTFVTASTTTGVKFILEKNTSTTNASYDISGLMLIEDDSDSLARYPLELTNYARPVTGTGASTSIQAITEDFGDEAVDFVSGTDLNSNCKIGALADALAFVVPSTAYTMVFWIRSESASYDAVDLGFRVRRAHGSEVDQLVVAAAPVPFASGWVKKVFNFTTDASTTSILLLVNKVGSTTNASWDLSGFMVLPGTLADADFERPDALPAAFNAGAVSLYENITAYVKAMRWNIGAREAYVAVADMNVLELELNNVSKIFSPEFSSSPIFGNRADRKVEVYGYGPSSSDWTLMFRGYIESLLPTPGANGPFDARLVATSNRRYFEGKQVRIALQVSVNASTVLIAIYDEIDMPAGVAVSYAHDGGTFTWPYAGDNWEDGTDALGAIAEVVQSERGILHWRRNDAIEFLSRTSRYDSDDTVVSLSATFDNAQEAMDYRYGDVVYNDIEVVRYPRRASSSTTLLLWTLDEDFTLAIGEQYTIFARYTNGEEAKTIGAVTGTVAEGTFTASGAGVTRTLTPKSNGCEILYNNTSGATRTVTAHTITGQRITAKDAVTVNFTDATSIAAYGRRTLRLDLKQVAAKADAAQIGALELARHKDPFGRVASVTIGQHDATHEQHIVDRTIYEKIRVIEDQTAHDGTYIIVGEEHEVSEALTVHKTTYYLEPAADLI